MVQVESNPPLAQDFYRIPHQYSEKTTLVKNKDQYEKFDELPLIDLKGLTSRDNGERAKCATEIARASTEWGFFQVVNHGIGEKLLNRMRIEQMKLFHASFSKKSTCGLLNNSYRWGTPAATSPDYFSWSEAFHVPLTKISDQACYGEFSSLRDVLMEYASAMQKLAKTLARVLIMNLGQKVEDFQGKICCDESTCFVRLNRYPSCSLSQEIYGFVPHTDSDFLTILHQDQVGGLQLMKDSKWVAVKPNKDALIVNIGDLFQAWSNDLYKSVEHRVMANAKMERFSVAYFLCPSYDSLIESCQQPSIYRSFTFGEYRKKVQEDSKLLGRKVGLSRFLR
ncbi:Iron/ascorbate family oxidoreductase [Handroanthus impetiginosus]|uniref:gibberellin 2beta-dioxygenase n=1 Tax=Handroanthus impetiginosus TaxID=429701 RepID=A0A2G9GQ64_9LAMI|nr:Iron/ascorbate family oxidoreductase [Handroanthus impetiginosus]